MRTSPYATGQSLSPSYVFVIAKGLIRGFIISLLLIAAVSLVLTYANVPDTILPYAAFGLSLVGILGGSIYVGKEIGTRGWLKGGITGLIYVTILVIISLLLINGYGVGLYILQKLFIGFVLGAVGGIIGINY